MTSPTLHDSPNHRPYITCRQVLEFIMAYLDGELTAEQRREFDRHLAVCPSCVNYLETYRATIKIGQALGHSAEEAAPDHVPDRLVDAVRNARRKKG